MAREIPLGKGVVTLVDDEDFDRFSALSWRALCPDPPSGKLYAVRSVWTAGRSRQIYMHREVLGLTDRRHFADHINGNGLDNRRANLRVATSRQNAINRVYAPPPSGYRGVHAVGGKVPKWKVILESEGVTIHAGRLESVEEAARLYDRLAEVFHGEFAVLNFPHRRVA